MTDLFKEKAENYDADDWSKEISSVIGAVLLSKIPFHDQMHVMDFGAGTGLICSSIAPVVRKITAVDISKAMLEKLMAKPELQKNVEVLCRDIMINPIDESFDLIVSGFAMHHVEDTNKLIQTFAGHLKTGSRLALVDVDKEDGSFHGDDDKGVFHKGFDREALKILMKKHSFKNIDIVTAHNFEWEGRKYSAFLATAMKG